MKKMVHQVIFASPVPKRKRVGAYARVSCGKDAMLHSLSAQVSFYSNLIQSHSDWEYCGVYADEAISGTKDKRDNFQKMLEDCRAGKLDMIITKSISRFARNTLTLLESVRELKSYGVDVFFEEQNIHTISSDGELLLTIIAAYAQAESFSVSENMRWRVQKNFEEGKPWNCTVLGYRYNGERFEIVPEEAEIVRRIFREYLQGDGFTKIANRLTEEGITTRRGYEWHKTSVGKILRNYTYTGNLILQTTFTESHMSTHSKVNDGSMPMYNVVASHEAIIPIEEYKQVQLEIIRRAENKKPYEETAYPFMRVIQCGCCGKNYRRKVTASGPVWICPTYNSKGKKYCASKAIPEGTLEQTVKEHLNVTEIDRVIVKSQIAGITALNGNILEITLTDGKVIVKRWNDRSRAESWTEEMKQAASRRMLERRCSDGNS